jgi:parallel beta-helix repeat protein
MGLTKVTYAMINGASFNVYDFGAVGDGVADDTAAFQAALDAIEASDTTCSLWVPAGTYIISDTLTYNQTSLIKSVSVIGEDETKTILRFTGTGGCLSFTLGTIDDQKANRLTIKNLTLYATEANAGAAIRIDRTAWVGYSVAPTTLIEDVNIGQDIDNGAYWTYGIHSSNCQDFWINRCYLMFYGPTTIAGIFFDNDTDRPTYGAYISNCSMNGAITGVYNAGWTESVYLTDTSIVGSTTCVHLTSTDTPFGNTNLNVTACHFNCKYRVIDTAGWRSVFITGSDIYSGVGAGDVDGTNIYIQSASKVVISGSKIEIGAAAGLARNFITLVDTVDFSITGNTMSNASAAGILLTGTCGRGTITGNTITGFQGDAQSNEGIYNVSTGNNFTYSANVIVYFVKGIYVSTGNNHAITGNTFTNMSEYGVYVNTNGVDNVVFNNSFRQCTSDVFAEVANARREVYRLGAITGATIASGAILTRSFSTPGCQVGDFVDVGAPFDLQGMSATANVTADDSCTLTVTNLTGASKVLADGTWNFRFHN